MYLNSIVLFKQHYETNLRRETNLVSGNFSEDKKWSNTCAF